MSALPFSHLVAHLYARGVTYWATADGKLHLEAPTGALTDEDWTAVAAHKDDLLFLCAGGVTIYGQGREPAWLREEFGRAGRGPRADGRSVRSATTEARP